MATNQTKTNKSLGDPIETPNWQFNTIPGNANQGDILMAKTDIEDPPLQQGSLVWKAMEDIIGVANMKLEYDEAENKFTLYKAKGHRSDDGQWSFQWTIVGSFNSISDAVQEALLNMEYISYDYDTTTSPGELIIYGVKKDGTRVEIARVGTADPQVISDITTRLTNLENNVYTKDQMNVLLSGKQNNLQAGTGITISAGSVIATNIINDTITSTTTTWSSDTLKTLFEALQGVATIVVVPTLPTPLVNNTLYYVGNSSPYHIWLRSNDTTYDMGTTEIDLTNYYTKTQTDNLLLQKANVGDSYTKAETDTLLLAKQDTLTPGNGIDITNDNITAKIGDGLKFNNGNIKCKASNGILIDSNGISIKTNFNIKTTPLGSDDSKLALYSDGKIGVDFTESPVVITAENLYRYSIPIGQHSVSNIVIPNSNNFDFFEIGIEGICSLFTTIKTNYTDYASNIRPAGIGTDSTPPTGTNFWMAIFDNINLGAGTISNVRLAYAPNMTAWQFFDATAGSPLVVYVNGLKAK